MDPNVGSSRDDSKKVIIIGAGSTGLALAQGLKKVYVPGSVTSNISTDFATERHTTYRLRTK